MSDFEFENKPVVKRGKQTEKVVFEQKEQASLPIEKVQETETPNEDKSKKQYDKDELNKIFDEILFTGEYAEDVTIKGKLKVRFKTRNAEELSEISRVIDGTSFTLMQTMNESRLLLNLQYALLAYHGRDLSSLKMEDRAKFVRKLAGPVVSSLVDAMIKFDEKVSYACQELEENF